MINYIKASLDELLNKVSWPTLSQLQSSSLVVGMCSIIIAILIYLMDLGSQNLMSTFFKVAEKVKEWF